MPNMRWIPAYAKKLGVNLDDLLVSQPDSGEEALTICETLARSNALDVIVIDSVAALVPKAELEGEMGMATMGMQARLDEPGPAQTHRHSEQSPRPPAFSPTNCAKKSASCSAIRKPPPAAKR